MATKHDLIVLAMGERGYCEKSAANYKAYGPNCLYPKLKYAGADNYSKYAYELNRAGLGHPNGTYWCQSYVNWLYYTTFGKELANKLLCGKLGSASTMEVKNAFVAKKQTVLLSSAQPGDIVFRTRNGGGHVGIVLGWKNGKIWTSEGNTSSSDISAWNGGCVAEHEGAYWQWCCRPDWSLIETKEERKPSVYRWIASGGLWYYQDQYGANYHGWAKIKESAGAFLHWYYFGKTGAMLTGAQKIDGQYYFLMPEGPLQGACCITNASGALEVWGLSEHSEDDKMLSNQIMDLINEKRKQVGVSALSYREDIAYAADLRAQESSKVWSHTRPNNTPYYTVDNRIYGENLSKNYKTAKDIVNAWMNSETHKTNMLDGRYKGACIGICETGGNIYVSLELTL